MGSKTGLIKVHSCIHTILLRHNLVDCNMIASSFVVSLFSLSPEDLGSIASVFYFKKKYYILESDDKVS